MLVITRYLDNDGRHINLLVLSLFVQHLPELIKAKKVFVALPPLYKAKLRNKTHFLYSESDLENFKNAEITRFKGIGEMSPDELWETTMNPKTRTLVELNSENFAETFALFNTLMGKSSAARKAFINEHNLSDDLDFDFFDEMEDID